MAQGDPNGFNKVLKEKGFSVPKPAIKPDAKPPKGGKITPKARPQPKLNAFQKTVKAQTGIDPVNVNLPGEKSLTQLSLSDPTYDERVGKAAGRSSIDEGYYDQELIRTMADEDIKAFGVVTFGDLSNVPLHIKSHPNFEKAWLARMARKEQIQKSQKARSQQRAALNEQMDFLKAGGITPDIEEALANDAKYAKANESILDKMSAAGYQALSPISGLVQVARDLGKVAGGEAPSGPSLTEIGSAIAKDQPGATRNFGSFLLNELAGTLGSPISKSVNAAGMSIADLPDEAKIGVVAGDILAQGALAAASGGAALTLAGKGARFALMDVPSYAQMLSNNGGDLQKTGAQFGTAITNGLNPNFLLDPNVPVDQKVMSAAAAFGMAWGGLTAGKRLLTGGPELYSNGLKGFTDVMLNGTTAEKEAAALRQMAKMANANADPAKVRAVEAELIERGIAPDWAKEMAPVMATASDELQFTLKMPQNKPPIAPESTQGAVRPAGAVPEGVAPKSDPVVNPEASLEPSRIEAARARNRQRMEELKKGGIGGGAGSGLGGFNPGDIEYVARMVYDKILDGAEYTSDLIGAVAREYFGKDIPITKEWADKVDEFVSQERGIENLDHKPVVYSKPAKSEGPPNSPVIPYANGGGFSSNQKGNKWDIFDATWHSPTSTVDQLTGETVVPGSYERHLGSTGRAASDLLVQAGRTVTDYTNRALEDVDAISQLIGQDTRGGIFGRKGRMKQAEEEFIKLIERDLDDPERVAIAASDTPLGKAVVLHDMFAENMRRFIIDMRRSYGLDTPDDWGITERGYYHHAFFGDIDLFEIRPDGTRVLIKAPDGRRFRSYAEAEAYAASMLSENPNLKFYAEGRDFNDTNMGRAERARIMRDVYDAARDANGRYGVNIDLDAIRGIANKNRRKFTGYTLKREGADGYSMNYRDTMEGYARRVVRTQALNKLARDLAPVIEDANKISPTVGAAIQKHLDYLFDPISDFEKLIGNTIANNKFLSGLVTNPDMWLRNAVGINGSFQYGTRIKYKPSAWGAQILQPVQTILPETKLGNFYRVVREAYSKDSQEALSAAGVIGGNNKFNYESGATSISSKKRGFEPFRAGADKNRSIGYIYGWEDAMRRQGIETTFSDWIKGRGASDMKALPSPDGAARKLAPDAQGYKPYTDGMTPEEITAHNQGLEWAARAEGEFTDFTNNPMLRTTWAKPFTQFKGFQMFMLKDTFGRRVGDTDASYWGRVAKKLAVQTTIGGGKAVMATPNLALKGLTAYWAYTTMKNLTEAQVANGKSYSDAERDAENVVNAIMYGLPGIMGLDFSGNVTLLDLYGNSNEDKLLGFFGGPFISSLMGLFDATSSGMSGKGFAGLERAIDKQVSLSKPAKALAGKLTTSQPSGDKRPANSFESLMNAGGFRTMSQSEEWDRKEHNDYKKIPFAPK